MKTIVRLSRQARVDRLPVGELTKKEPFRAGGRDCVPARAPERGAAAAGAKPACLSQSKVQKRSFTKTGSGQT